MVNREVSDGKYDWHGIMSTRKSFIDQVNDHIDHHIDDPGLSIASLAGDMDMSRASLFRKIKSKTGVSPSMHICRRRLSLARLMLTQSELQISEIAYSLGFNTPSYFTRKFRERYGMSPSEFRNLS